MSVDASPRAPVSRLSASVDDVIEHVLVDPELEALELELARHARDHVGAQDVLERAGVERLERHDAREPRDQLGQEAVGLEVGDVLDLVGGEIDGDRVGIARGLPA